MKRDYNYYDKFLERENKQTKKQKTKPPYTWVPNIGYCIQEKLQIRCYA